MTPVFWALLAVTAAYVFIHLSARKARALRPPLELPLGESLPTTPLERLAGRTLVATLGLTAVAAIVVGMFGPQAFWDDDRIRLTVTGLLVAALVGVASVGVRTSRWTVRGGTMFDEHDRAILAGASSGQSGAMLIVLAVWIIALVETHQDTRQISTVFLYLIFWSCLMASLLAWLAGIVIGYRRR